MSNDSLLSKSKDFIQNNSDLFKDGDVFTAAPEAENGGQYNQVDPSEYDSYRKLLIAESTTMLDAL